MRIAAAWGQQADQLRITTWGSSGCPSLPDVVERTGNRIEVTTVEYNPHGDGCNADASPTTSVIKVPAGIDRSTDVTVVVDGTELLVTRR